MDVTRKSARKWIDSLSLRVQQALFAAAAYLILLAICLLAISPEQYDLSVGDVAPKTITASKDIVDELTTERRRRAAADAVSPVYYKDDTVSYTVLSDMDAVFSELRAVRELGEQIRNAWGDEGGSFTEADYAQASGLVTRLSLSNYQLRTLMNTGESDFESLYQSLVSATRTTLVSTITEGQINDAINNIQQIVSYNTRTDLWYNVAIPTLRASLKANMLIDQAATEENRQKACDAVEPTVYKQDQNIVVKGDRVTAEQIAVLESLGLLEGNSFDYPLYIGTAITLAEGIVENLAGKQGWVNLAPGIEHAANRIERSGEAPADRIEIRSVRKGAVPGIHTVTYESEDDVLEIRHTIKNRRTLALGAVVAAEFLCGKQGVFGMDDLLK